MEHPKGMEIKLEEYTYYISLGYTDMRKQSRTLALLVQNEMGLNPFEKSIFVFCGKSRMILKALCWNGNGWLEITKRIETKDRFKCSEPSKLDEKPIWRVYPWRLKKKIYGENLK